MACSNMQKPELKLKLLVDTARRTVLFAEAGKDVVDFLFSMLALPLGEVVRLLTKQSMVGCLGNLYGSVENLEDAYMEVNRSKSDVLAPKVASPAFSDNNAAALTWKKEENPTPTKYYRCADYQSPNCYKNCYRRGCGYVTDDLSATCPHCSGKMTTEMKYISPTVDDGKLRATTNSGVVGGAGGLVKGVVTYMVMDDLVVTPMSTISGITLINKYGVKDVGLLEEKMVNLDMNKALEMLKTSLQSTTILTDVFLSEKSKRSRANSS